LNAAVFVGAGAALGIVDHLWRSFARFKLCAHLLDLRSLLFQTRCDSLQLLGDHRRLIFRGGL
jgi:hypothetical protein